MLISPAGVIKRYELSLLPALVRAARPSGQGTQFVAFSTQLPSALYGPGTTLMLFLIRDQRHLKAISTCDNTRRLIGGGTALLGLEHHSKFAAAAGNTHLLPFSLKDLAQALV
jgi:hypothetical protein